MRYRKIKQLLTSMNLNHNHVFSSLPFWILQPIIGRYYGNVWKELPVEAKVLFIHIPKCAGTSITRVLYGKDMGHRPVSLYLASDPQRFSSIPSFAVIRNPYDRFCSIFRHNRCPRYDHETAMFDDSFYSLYTDPCKFAHDLQCNKGLVNAFMSHILARPQIEWISIENRISVDHLFTYEELDNLQTFLSGHLEEPSFRLPHANASGRVRSWKEELDDDARRTIYNLYKDDFRLWESLSKA